MEHLFLARALNLSGVYLGDLDSLISHEWKPLEDNPRGHWENKKFYELSEKTLANNKGSWHEIPQKIVVNKKLGNQIKKNVKELQKNSNIAVGIKDPRILLCFDAWKQYLPKNFIIIGIYRDPLKVAESLKKRNNFSYEKSLNLWQIYNEKLLEILDRNTGFLLDFDWSKKRMLSEIKLIAKKFGLSENIDLSNWYSEELLKSNKTFQKKFKVPKDSKKIYNILKKKASKNKSVRVKQSLKIPKQTSQILNSILIDTQNQGKYFSTIFNEIQKNSKSTLDKIEKLQKELEEKISAIRIQEDSLKQKDEKITTLQKEFEDRSNWAISLDEQLKQKNLEITTLQKEFEDRSNWAISLDEQLKQKTLEISNLKKDFDVRLSVLEQQADELKQKDAKIASLQKEYEEITTSIQTLESEKDEVSQKLKNLNETISPKDLEIQNLKNAVETKNSQIQNLQNQIEELRRELNEIKNSVMYGVTSNIARKLDKLAPESTRRRNALRLSSAAYLMRKERGTKALLHEAKSRIVKTKFHAKKSDKPNTQGFLKNLDSTKFSKNVLKIDVDFQQDISLRKFMQFGSNNITNLSSFSKISIIIPTYNQLEALKRNLSSIKSKTTYKNYEIIIVTNNLDENSDMRKYLKTIDDQVYVYPEYYSFGGMNNFAASKAQGEFLLFLNDDIEVVSPNWLEAFLSLALNESTGAVGAKILSSNGKLQDTGGIVWKNGNAWNFGRFHDPNEPKFNYVRDVDYCSGSCLFVKKEIFEKIGGFDRTFDPAYWEDTDLCYSIRKLGYQILYQPLASLIHYEGLTQGTSTSQGLKSHQVENQKKFQDKWKTVLDTHLEDSSENSFFERDRREGLNILYIDHYIPEPDRDSGSLRTFGILGILSHMKNKVTFWSDNQKFTIPYATELQQKGIEVIYKNKDFEKFIDERKNLYDVAILVRPYISVKYIDSIKKKMPNCKIIYDTIDLHYLRLSRQASLENKNDPLQAKMMKEMELSMMRKSDLSILTSTAEADFLHKEDESLQLAILPNIHTPREKVEDFEGRNNMMFLGGFQHEPNIDAVKYLVKEIWPKIKKRIPDAKLYIIGSNPTTDIKNLAAEDIIITGFVKDLETFYGQFKVMLAPLRFGAGVKGKITQSLAMGLPVVTTSIGAEGIKAADGKNCLIADNPDDFAKKASQVYSKKELWKTLSENGIKSTNEFSPERARACLESIISSIM